MNLKQYSLVIGLVTGLAACSNGNAPSPTGQKFSFSVATKAAGAANGPAFSVAAAAETLGVGNDTLVYDTVQVLVRKIDLERTDASMSCDGETEDNHSGMDNTSSVQPSDGNDGHEDDCEEVNAGPLILDLPLSVGATHVFSVQVDTGTYHKVHFRIHQPTDDPGDQALLQQHPEFTGISVRVKGEFNGTPFSYTNDLTANQEAALVPPVTVTGTPLDLTLFVDVGTWFKDAAGNLVDPASAASGQPNENLVTDNIKDSFRAFKDHDGDGEDDEHEGDHGGGSD